MKFPASFKDATLLRKLMYIALLATAGATLFALLLLIIQQWFLQRNELAKSVYAQASIVAINSSSAMLFDDRRAAEQTLGALAAIDNIEYAAIVDKSGKEFAVYVRAGATIPFNHHPAAGKNIDTMKFLEVVVPVVFKQEPIGAIHVISGLKPVYDRLLWSILVIAVAATGAFWMAVMMLKRLLPVITDPLLSLVGLMSAVSRDKNYSLRAQLQSRDELGTLAQGFNNMLAQIQARDNMLEQQREHLEDEVALRTSRLTEAQRIAHLGSWEMNSATNQVFWTEELYRMLGLNPALPAPDYTEQQRLFTPESWKRLNAALPIAQESGVPYELELELIRPDGVLGWMLARGEPLRDSSGTIVGLKGVALDITARKRAEEEIRRLNEVLEEKVEERTKQLIQAQQELVRKEKLAVLGQVAGSVGHELRNPLGVMNNAVYFLQTVLSDANETTREYLNIIKSEIANSERIVSDLLDSVRTTPPHLEIVGVRELLEQTLRQCTVPPSVTVALDIPTTLPPLRVDGMQIHQVLRNLINNGVEAMPEGGTLNLHASQDAQAKTISLRVHDSGSGMTTEQQSHLFQPLFTTKARGIGLGLVVVQNLTRANGGNIEVQSAPGHGTTFTVTLPAADERGISL